jgi:RNA polymerase sigma-70 factor (ECF subfamily)
VSDTGSAARSDRFEELFEAHHGRLYVLAVRMAVAGDDATDLVQETFLRAVGSRRPIPPGDAAERWLVRILVNLCRDRYRRRKYRSIRRAELQPRRETRAPEEAVTAHEAVHAALARLPARRRAVVVLRELEERDTADVAALLGMRAITVRWHLSQGRKQLRSLLDGEEGRR